MAGQWPVAPVPGDSVRTADGYMGSRSSRSEIMSRRDAVGAVLCGVGAD